MTTIAEARRALATKFATADLDSPDLDARLLVAHALALDHAALAMRADEALTPSQLDTITVLAARRLTREPVARILGEWEFWGLRLTLNAATLVPRPDTETVVEAALAALPHKDTALIADIGTGSGAILLALLTELPGAFGVGTDASIEALACAGRNAADLGLAPRATFIACNYGEALRGPFDLVVSNPPYVAQGDIASLAPEVRDFDPPRALDGGYDGLDAYRAIAADARRLLKPEGVMVVELGAGRRAPVTAVFAAHRLTPAGPARADLSGTDRALVLTTVP